MRIAVLLAILPAIAGCATANPSPSTSGGNTVSSDSTRRQVSLAGRGSLRQDAISVKLQFRGILAQLFPLDSGVIELLAPDSYRNMRGLLDANRERIERARMSAGVEKFSIWYVTFRALEPDARFSARDLVIAGAGRDFRPIDLIPLSSGFGEQRIQQGQSQTALYLFDAGLDTTQPLEVSMETARSVEWSSVLQVLERERTRLRSGRIDTLATTRQNLRQTSSGTPEWY